MVKARATVPSGGIPLVEPFRVRGDPRGVRKLLLLIVAFPLVVVVHDLRAEPCARWYRLPLQLASDLLREMGQEQPRSPY